MNADLMVALANTTAKMLEARQYGCVAESIREAQRASEQEGNLALAEILAATQQLCLACDHCLAEEEWHQNAYMAAERRERELTRLLQTIFTSIGGRAGEAAPAPPDIPAPAAPPDWSAPQRDIPAPAETLSLWQRIQGVLGRGTTAWPPEHTTTETIAPPAEPARQDGGAAPDLTVYCLGPLRVYQDNRLIANWASGKGKAIFRYLIANRGQPVSKDILMDLFWRDAEPEAARNNLNVAIHGLRQTFRAARPDVSYIMFQDGHYTLNPALRVWVDVEELVRLYETGQNLERQGDLAAAMRAYAEAERLYQGDFFEEDLYEDWPVIWRESLRDSYLIMLDRLSSYYLDTKRYQTCAELCQKILAKDDCREDAHRRLMRCYSRQGKRSLALRQYDLCAKALAQTLDVSPMDETTELRDQIRRKVPV